MKRSYKRIIDVEKEAIVLLINALEAIGDLYGIYGFSGYGRENVEFYTIKDLDENFSDRVKKRIDRVAPLHATRMGPAIRHTTYKLDKQDARTKLMFLISDGRPQDRGYSARASRRSTPSTTPRWRSTKQKIKASTPSPSPWTRTATTTSRRCAPIWATKCSTTSTNSLHACYTCTRNSQCSFRLALIRGRHPYHYPQSVIGSWHGLAMLHSDAFKITG